MGEFDGKIVLAEKGDTEEVLKLYRSFLHGPAAWDEHYPSLETIDFDLNRNALFVMKNDADEILAAISIDEDDLVNELPVWSSKLQPSGELARLCVRQDCQGLGIGKRMMKHCFLLLKEEGKKSIHILVRPDHKIALKTYSKLGFVQVGECHLYEKDYVCMEIAL